MINVSVIPVRCQKILCVFIQYITSANYGQCNGLNNVSIYRNSFEKLVNSYSLQESRKANPEKKKEFDFKNYNIIILKISSLQQRI